MKKNLFLSVMLIGLSTTAYQAQTQKGVGINTTTPATTLDVTATTTDNTIADAVLVPRLTATELNNKNGAFSTSQNGALVFVTAGTGTASTKTELVTGKGFYYFDAAAASNVGRWTALAGSSIPSATLPTYRYVTGGGDVTITVNDVGNIVVFNAGNSGNIILPTPNSTMIGKKLTIIETFGTIQTLTDKNSAIYRTNTLGSLQQYGSEFITDGNYWYALGGQ